MWKAAARIHYSNPWTRALLWTSGHLDVQWAVRLIGALINKSNTETVLWTLSRGTAVAAVHHWLLDRGWVLTGPWKWLHALSGVTLDLSRPTGAPLLPRTLKERVGKEQHALRQGWRAWAAVQWLQANRHELKGFDLWTAGGLGLRKVQRRGGVNGDGEFLAGSLAARAVPPARPRYHVVQQDCCRTSDNGEVACRLQNSVAPWQLH